MEAKLVDFTESTNDRKTIQNRERKLKTEKFKDKEVREVKLLLKSSNLKTYALLYGTGK